MPDVERDHRDRNPAVITMARPCGVDMMLNRRGVTIAELNRPPMTTFANPAGDSGALTAPCDVGQPAPRHTSDLPPRRRAMSRSENRRHAAPARIVALAATGVAAVRHECALPSGAGAMRRRSRHRRTVRRPPARRPARCCARSAEGQVPATATMPRPPIPRRRQLQQDRDGVVQPGRIDDILRFIGQRRTPMERARSFSDIPALRAQISVSNRARMLTQNLQRPEASDAK